jgi:hypothetical protein
MSNTKTPTVRAARQGFEMLSSAASVSNSTLTFLENQRHSPVDWLAARANVALPTARLFAELHGFAGCR